MTQSTLTLPATAAIPGAVAPTQEQRELFARTGFLRWGPLLAPGEVATLQEEYDRLFTEAEAAGTYRNLSAGNAADAAAMRDHPQQMIQIMQMCERSLAFRRLLFDERILTVVRALIGPSVLLFHDQALYKRAHAGGPIAWHQDNGYWQCAPANLVSCWLTLDDADAGNGAMQVVSGAHHALQRHATADTTALLELATPSAEEVTLVPLPAGGCMFHHCQTPHYTAPNVSSRPRRAFAMHFMPPGTRDREGRVMRASWSHPALSIEI